ncbi:MAG: DUF4126 domain-containing protein [Myxococcales bacterium]|nr:DUF4126 domain-containing protein [Myxococcales bacterium]
MDLEFVQPALHVVMGLCLAATCGLRTFLPLLVLNLLALAGMVELNETFSFVGTWPAGLVFGSATLVELVGDKIPGVDHLLDGLGLVAKPVAGTLLGAAVLNGADPLLAGVLGLIGGGGSASVIGLAKANIRAISTLSTAGLGNAVLSLLEDVIALISVTLAVLVPALAALLLMAMAFWLLRSRPEPRAA